VLFTEHGRVEIDNNAAERALRAIALGRKSYLFACSDAGGERAAAIYSLLGSAKLNGIGPEAWMTEVLWRVSDHPVHRIAELLPWNLFPVAPRRHVPLPVTNSRYASLLSALQSTETRCRTPRNSLLRFAPRETWRQLGLTILRSKRRPWAERRPRQHFGQYRANWRFASRNLSEPQQ
jgi:hypothetical protein